MSESRLSFNESLKLEEYRTLREEMIKNFSRGDKYLFYAAAFIGALIAWVATDPLSTNVNTQNISFEFRDFLFFFSLMFFSFFVLIVCNYLYNALIKGAYDAGSYLTVFYEMNTENNWHYQNRFLSETINGLEISPKTNIKTAINRGVVLTFCLLIFGLSSFLVFAAVSFNLPLNNSYFQLLILSAFSFFMVYILHIFFLWKINVLYSSGRIQERVKCYYELYVTLNSEKFKRNDEGRTGKERMFSR